MFFLAFLPTMMLLNKVNGLVIHTKQRKQRRSECTGSERQSARKTHSTNFSSKRVKVAIKPLRKTVRIVNS